MSRNTVNRENLWENRMKTRNLNTFLEHIFSPMATEEMDVNVNSIVNLYTFIQCTATGSV